MPFYGQGFPLPGLFSQFLCRSGVTDVLSDLLEMGQRLHASLVILIPLTAPAQFPASFLHLCCACLQEIEQGCLSQERTALPLHGSHCSHILFFLTVCYQQQSLSEINNNPCLFLPAALGWLHSHPALSVFETDTFISWDSASQGWAGARVEPFRAVMEPSG